MADFKYHLQPYTNNRESRHECPQCHDKRSFTRYVDDDGNILDERVGRCNHESGCGYHYTPARYFQDHPDLSRNVYEPKQRVANVYAQVKPQPSPCTVPADYLKRTFDRELKSDLARWLSKYFDKDDIGKAFQRYMVGVDKYGRTIFWQVDVNWQVRTGKIIQYDPDTGHRLHDGDDRLIGGIEANWVHSMLKRAGQLPKDWTLSQCLFGEHLLKGGLDKRPIAVVEGEKSAVIASIRFPQFLWLACGGLRQFSESKMKTLRGRSVTLYPDAGGYDVWEEVRHKLSGYARVKVSDILQEDDPSRKGWDIADLIIDEIEHPDDPRVEMLRYMEHKCDGLHEFLRLFDCVIV